MSKDTIKIKYIFKDDYNPSYATGVYGGICPNGDLAVNFFFERLALPYTVEHELIDNSLGDIVSIEPSENQVVRFVSDGVVLNKETSINVYKWLSERLIEMGVDVDELGPDNK